MKDERWSWVYRFRGIFMIPIFLFMMFSNFHECENEQLVFPLAGGLFFGGLSLRVWAQMHLHYRLSVKKHLTTTGPYRFVRNPIYIGNTMILTGACVLSELLWLVPVLLLWCALVYSLVVRKEEAHLRQKYGESYEAFLRQTPRWIPRLSHRDAPRERVRQFFLSSVRAELYCFLYILPFVFKEMVSEYFWL